MDKAVENMTLKPANISLGKPSLILLSILQLIGLYVSDLLTMEHIGLKLGDTADSGLCGVSEIFSCKAAAASVYSQIAGLPIAVIGEAYYVCALLLLVLARFLPYKFRKEALLTFGVTASLSGLYSLFLGAVSLLDLGFLCPLCMALYDVNLGTLAILWWGKALRPRSWFPLMKTPVPWLTLVIMMISLVGTQGIYATRFHSEYQIAKKKLAKSKKPTFKQIDLGQAPVKGEHSAALIIEYSDFQCPFCKRFTKHLKTAYQESLNQNGFSYAFKHFPLSPKCNPHIKRDMHPRACHAAIAAICAQEQGQFWAMHDLLFGNQHKLEDEDLKSYAESLKLDMNQFKDCLNSEQASQKLSADIASGAQAGVRGTPAFFVNGWGFKGAKRATAIKQAVAEYAYGIKPLENEEKSQAK